MPVPFLRTQHFVMSADEMKCTAVLISVTPVTTSMASLNLGPVSLPLFGRRIFFSRFWLEKCDDCRHMSSHVTKVVACDEKKWQGNRPLILSDVFAVAHRIASTSCTSLTRPL